jgi:hypothetical protein
MLFHSWIYEQKIEEWLVRTRFLPAVVSKRSGTQEVSHLQPITMLKLITALRLA